MKKDIEIIDNYVDEVNESPYFKKLFTLYNEKISEQEKQLDLENSKQKINNIIQEFNTKNINEILYPHIKTFIFSKLYNNKNIELSAENLLDLHYLISNEIYFNETIQEYYSKIITINCFGIPKELYKEKILTYEMSNSSSYKKFVYSLSKWYTLTEILILNLYLLEKFFNKKFEYNTDYKIVENNNNLNINNKNIEYFSKRNFFKLGSILVNNTSDIASSGIVNIIFNSIVCNSFEGINNILTICKSYVKTYLIGNIFGDLGKNIEKKSNSNELNKITNNIEGLNNFLDEINNKIINLINNEIKIYIYNQIGEYKEKYVLKNNELEKEIKNLLKAFDNEDDDFLKKLSQKEIEDEWIEVNYIK